ncbi:hypothetical protein ACIGXM_08605 [Kitasatospora sp. NPDC052896]|uniref:hypothetical protein n=1 Tax=Kitasatospora sp. NPDC052896 TaxID=3364061 RepID=UPI0037C5275E
MRTSSQAAARGAVQDLPVLLVAVVRGSGYLAVKRLTRPETVVPMPVPRFAVVLPPLGVAARRGPAGLWRAEWLGGDRLGALGPLGGALVLAGTEWGRRALPGASAEPVGGPVAA